MMLIDFAARRIPAADIKAAGFGGVVAYVSQSRPGSNFGAKPLTRDYADELRAQGLHIVSNYQFGKPGGTAPSDFTRGFDGGVKDARTALHLHEAAGGPDSAPIIFSIDDDIGLGTWNGVAVEWFRGINSVLGVERTGVYGHSRVCAWAIQDGVIGRSTSPDRRWAWQTKAWSHGQREPAAVLFQRVVDTPSNPGPPVGGIRVDVNDVLADDFGQWDLDRAVSARSLAGAVASAHGYPGSPIMEGATGPDVAMIQGRLNTVAGAGLLVDGECAALTGRAIVTFQRGHGLDADGKVGSRTWDQLFATNGHANGAAAGTADRASAALGSCGGEERALAEVDRAVADARSVSGDPVWLEDVLRPALGDRLRTLPGWKDSGTGGTMGQIWGIIWHHTGNARASAQSIRNGRPDLSGPLAQLHIAPDGIVTIVAVGPCNHAGEGSWRGLPTDNANRLTIGIECAWPFDLTINENTQTRERWKDAQIISMRDVGAAITKHLGVTADHNISHEEWARFGPAGFRQGKWDPGNLDMNWFRGEIDKDMRGEFDRGIRNGLDGTGTESLTPPQTSDYVLEIREQLRIEWPQLGGQTLLDAVAEIRDKVCGTNDAAKR